MKDGKLKLLDCWSRPSKSKKRDHRVAIGQVSSRALLSQQLYGKVISQLMLELTSKWGGNRIPSEVFIQHVVNNPQANGEVVVITYHLEARVEVVILEEATSEEGECLVM